MWTRSCAFVSEWKILNTMRLLFSLYVNFEKKNQGLKLKCDILFCIIVVRWINTSFIFWRVNRLESKFCIFIPTKRLVIYIPIHRSHRFFAITISSLNVFTLLSLSIYPVGVSGAYFSFFSLYHTLYNYTMTILCTFSGFLWACPIIFQRHALI